MIISLLFTNILNRTIQHYYLKQQTNLVLYQKNHNEKNIKSILKIDIGGEIDINNIKGKTEYKDEKNQNINYFKIKEICHFITPNFTYHIAQNMITLTAALKNKQKSCESLLDNKHYDMLRDSCPVIKSSSKKFYKNIIF